jgi:NTE family protein
MLKTIVFLLAKSLALYNRLLCVEQALYPIQARKTMIFRKDPPQEKDQVDKDSTAEDSLQPDKTATRNEPRIGLALGSGLARGFAHIGAIRALERHGIRPTFIAGTSMGALVGGAYLADRMDNLEEWACALTRFKVLSYLDFRVKSAGMIGGERLVSLMEDNFGDIKAEDLRHPFTAVAADLVTGHEVWMRKGRLVDMMRASFSLPGIFPPVFWNNHWLIDGALVNPVPVSPCQAMGARMTIAINPNADIIGKATRPGQNVPTVAGFDVLGNTDNPETGIKAASIGMTRRLFKREQDKPSMFGVMVSSLNIVQDRLARSRLAGDPPDVLINPRIGHIGLMEFDRAEELIEEGEAAVERAMPDIKAAYSVLCTRYEGFEDGESPGF